MQKKDFKGIYTALLTPYSEDGAINIDALYKLIDFNIKAGVNGFYVGGSTGKGAILSPEKRKEVFSAVAKINAGRVTLIGHVGSTSTETSVELAKFVTDHGYDAVSAVAPYYYSYVYDAVKQYYYDIAEASGAPLIIYNYPLSGSFNLTPRKAQDLLQNEKIIGIKHTSQDLYMISRFKELEHPPIVYNGYDEMLAGGLTMGADGGIGSTYNFMPHRIVALYRAFQRGDLKETMRLQTEVNKIISAIIDEAGRCGVMNCEKWVLTYMGIPMGECKRPFLSAGEEEKSKMREIAGILSEEVSACL